MTYSMGWERAHRACPSCDSLASLATRHRSCGGTRRDTCDGSGRLTNAELIVAVLERSSVPLATWDIVREVRSRYACKINSLNAAADLRLCWAGRGIWGLYRHGLLPGVRTASRVAA